jgi:acyl carrier protein
VMIFTEEELIGLVIQWVRENSPKADRVDVLITPDTNLFESGLLDSLGFVDLITFIEKHEGCQVDLADADPGEFAILKGICRLALKNSPPAEYKSSS